jgi:hypothetical protein
MLNGFACQIRAYLLRDTSREIIWFLGKGLSLFSLLLAFASNVLAESPDESDAASLLRSILVTQDAVRRYDVTIKRWSSKFPHNSSSERENAFQPYEQSSVYRLVIDRDAEKCLIVSRRRDQFARTERTKQAEKEVRNLHFLENGMAIARNTNATVNRDVAKKMDFSTFCRFARVEKPAMWGALPVHVPILGSSEEKQIDIVLKENSKSVVKSLPDGTKRILKPNADGQTIRTSVWVDIKKLVVTKRVTTKLTDGNWSDYYSHTIEYKDFEWISLPSYISYSSEGFVVSPLGQNGEVSPAEEVGTIELTWHQVNPDVLNFPSLKDLGEKPAVWEEFIVPKSDK